MEEGKYITSEAVATAARAEANGIASRFWKTNNQCRTVPLSKPSLNGCARAGVAPNEFSRRDLLTDVLQEEGRGVWKGRWGYKGEKW